MLNKIISHTENRAIIMATLHECNMEWVVNDKRETTVAFLFESERHHYYIMLLPVKDSSPRPMKMARFPKMTFSRDEVLAVVAELSADLADMLGMPTVTEHDIPQPSDN